jgi:hypothetical protein
MKRPPVLPITLVLSFWLAFAFAVATFAQTSAPATPSSPPPPTEAPIASLTIVGQITNGTPGGSLPITTSVLLHGYDGQTMALMTPGVADASGQFRFEGVENKGGRAFGVTATVGRTTYFSDLLPPDPGATELALALKIYDTTSDVSQVGVAQMYVLGEFLSEQELQIINAYSLSNKGDRAVEDSEKAPDGRPATLRFTLPKGATDVQIRGESAEHFILTDDGFLTTWGIPPGDNVSQVMVRYTLPYTGQLLLESQVQYSVQVVNVLLADQGVALASPQLQEQGTRQRQDGMMMRVYTGEALAAGQSLAFDLNGIPKVAPTGAGNAPRDPGGAATAPPAPAPDYRQRVALGLVALGLTLLGACAIWWARAARPTKEDDLAGVAAAHKALVQALADLDEAHEAREIADADYTRQRQTLKAALVSALENSPVATAAVPHAARWRMTDDVA